jgi:hypothetical protein
MREVAELNVEVSSKMETQIIDLDVIKEKTRLIINRQIFSLCIQLEYIFTHLLNKFYLRL